MLTLTTIKSKSQQILTRQWPGFFVIRAEIDSGEYGLGCCVHICRSPAFLRSACVHLCWEIREGKPPNAEVSAVRNNIQRESKNVLTATR
jgi:hypothetical protein